MSPIDDSRPLVTLPSDLPKIAPIFIPTPGPVELIVQQSSDPARPCTMARLDSKADMTCGSSYMELNSLTSATRGEWFDGKNCESQVCIEMASDGSVKLLVNVEANPHEAARYMSTTIDVLRRLALSDAGWVKEPEEPDTFDVRIDGALVCPYPIADYPTPEDVIRDMATWAEEADTLNPGVSARFEVWRGDEMVATARRDGETDHFIPGPPFDRSRGMPPGIIAAFDKCFSGVLDDPGPTR